MLGLSGSSEHCRARNRHVVRNLPRKSEASLEKSLCPGLKFAALMRTNPSASTPKTPVTGCCGPISNQSTVIPGDCDEFLRD